MVTRLTPEFGDVSPKEAADLVQLCDDAIAEYKAKRGRAIWEHRATGLGQVPWEGLAPRLYAV
jgi:hypothetical protein